MLVDTINTKTTKATKNSELTGGGLEFLPGYPPRPANVCAQGDTKLNWVVKEEGGGCCVLETATAFAIVVQFSRPLKEIPNDKDSGTR